MTDRSGSQIDHLNVAVPDLATAVAFYRPTLDSIGIVTILEIPADYTPGIPAMHGFGWPETKPFFSGRPGHRRHQHAPRLHRRHPRRGARVYQAALAAGAKDRDAPAVHGEYHPDYYGGFVTDPHGINLEAVCHHPE